jgi:PRTRC genetic system protein B
MQRSSPNNLIDTFAPDAVTRALTNEMRTTHALFFHQRKESLAMTTVHAVDTDADGIPIVGPGRPLDPEDEQTILNLLMSRDKNAPIEILPSCVLYRDQSTAIWWLPPLVRPMHLRSHEQGLQTILTRWPSLVALVRGRTLHLAAVEGDARPSADTPLHHAPLPNVYADTSVCTGSARLPLAMRVSDFPAWESVVFDTAFTHTNHTATLRPAQTVAAKSGGRKRKASPPKQVHSDAAYWATREGHVLPFPDGALNPLGLTLAQWLPALSRSNDRRVTRQGRF